mmetsp:Transcript_3057/g.4490  ORF Transcript_3057/g.4490 Transcript_3057/m.4490 type:complete len:237 (+) Transcript_3057:449-1159(+)
MLYISLDTVGAYCTRCNPCPVSCNLYRFVSFSTSACATNHSLYIFFIISCHSDSDWCTYQYCCSCECDNLAPSTPFRMVNKFGGCDCLNVSIVFMIFFIGFAHCSIYVFASLIELMTLSIFVLSILFPYFSCKCCIHSCFSCPFFVSHALLNSSSPSISIHWCFSHSVSTVSIGFINENPNTLYIAASCNRCIIFPYDVLIFAGFIILYLLPTSNIALNSSLFSFSDRLTIFFPSL